MNIEKKGIATQQTKALIQYKNVVLPVEKSHDNKTVIRSSHLHNGNSFTGKTWSLYGISHLNFVITVILLQNNDKDIRYLARPVI